VLSGVPFYGYGFGGAFRKDDYPYQEIRHQVSRAENADQAGKTIWYNGQPTIRAKASFVKGVRLGRNHDLGRWMRDVQDPRSAPLRISRVPHTK